MIEVVYSFRFSKRGFERVLETAIEEAATFGVLQKLLLKVIEDGG